MPSTVIDHFSYHPESSELKITFLSGKVYIYKNVPDEVFQGLKTAGSKGQYFNAFVKNKYKFKRL